MKYPSIMKRTQIIAITLGMFCVSIITLATWRATAFQKSSASSSANYPTSSKLHDGLGSEVKLASPDSSSEEIRASVESVASFIGVRSGLTMGEETKARLATMEQQTLKGEKVRIGVGEFTNALTDTFIERLSALTDKEISSATAMLKVNGGIFLRADGRLSAELEDFEAQAKSLREACRQNDKSVRAAIGSTLRTEVNSRIKSFGEGVPEYFNQSSGNGLTPLQSLLITYSVVADDPLDYSHNDLQKAVRNPANIKDGPHGKLPTRGNAYGPRGQLFSTPAHLVFNKATVNSLLERLAKGGSQDEK